MFKPGQIWLTRPDTAHPSLQFRGLAGPPWPCPRWASLVLPAPPTRLTFFSFLFPLFFFLCFFFSFFCNFCFVFFLFSGAQNKIFFFFFFSSIASRFPTKALMSKVIFLGWAVRLWALFLIFLSCSFSFFFGLFFHDFLSLFPFFQVFIFPIFYVFLSFLFFCLFLLFFLLFFFRFFLFACVFAGDFQTVSHVGLPNPTGDDRKQ